jgi:hypothetical protein
MIAAVTVAAIVVLLVSLRLFGDSELRLVFQRSRLFGRSFWQSAKTLQTSPHDTVVRFRGSMPWERFWESLVDAAEKLHLRRMSLNVNLWTINEVYYASWSQGTKGPSDTDWSCQLPLFVVDGQVGLISLTGVRNGQPMCEQLEVLLSLIEPFEEEFQEWRAQAGSASLNVVDSLGEQSCDTTAAAVK